MTEGVSLWDQFAALLASPMTQRSLLAALIVGVAAPVIGTYLVQRRLSLLGDGIGHVALTGVDRKSTRLNSSHVAISYAVFCLKKKNRHPADDTNRTERRDSPRPYA